MLSVPPFTDLFEIPLALFEPHFGESSMGPKVEGKKKPEVRFLSNARRPRSGKDILEHKAIQKRLTKEQKLKIKKRALKAKKPTKQPRFVSYLFLFVFDILASHV